MHTFPPILAVLLPEINYRLVSLLCYWIAYGGQHTVTNGIVLKCGVTVAHIPWEMSFMCRSKFF